MEALLKQLFDFQRFANNTALQSVIDETNSRVFSRELTLDELNMVYAAGEPEIRFAETDKNGDLP